jgi:hypothetical protein
VNVLLKLSDELGAEIDAERGDIPRTVWIRRAIEIQLQSLVTASTSEGLHPPGTDLKKGVAVGRGSAPRNPPPPARKYTADPKTCIHVGYLEAKKGGGMICTRCGREGT